MGIHTIFRIFVMKFDLINTRFTRYAQFTQHEALEMRINVVSRSDEALLMLRICSIKNTKVIVTVYSLLRKDL